MLKDFGILYQIKKNHFSRLLDLLILVKSKIHREIDFKIIEKNQF